MSERLLAIDPGSAKSGWCQYDLETREPIIGGKGDNFDVLQLIGDHVRIGGSDYLVIEQVGNYGRANDELYLTCKWSGRFIQVWQSETGVEPMEIKRVPVKVHLCGVANATDADVRARLRDIYGLPPGRSPAPKGHPLYGITGDALQALALARVCSETLLRDYLHSLDRP